MREKQGICTTTVTYATEFLIDAWNLAKSANTKGALASFLQEYTRFLHGGCDRKLHIVHDEILERFISTELNIRTHF